jgi:hypothetical protein
MFDGRVRASIALLLMAGLTLEERGGGRNMQDAALVKD